MLQIARCADAAVVDFPHALVATLLDNFRREIDLVMRRTNAGTELHDQIGRLRSELLDHLGDCTRNNAELRPLAAGMDETDSWRVWIDNVNRAAVGDMNAERDTRLICNEAVAAGEMFILVNRSIDNCDLIAVNLFGGKQRAATKSSGMTNLAVRFLEPRQCFSFIM